MGYMHIDNLYKEPGFLAGEDKAVYVLEKIHGTSAHVRWTKEEGLKFFSGGEKMENFVKLFNEEALKAAFAAAPGSSITVYGEAYGGRQQGMKDTYGDRLCFVAFDVLVDGRWLEVPEAANMASSLGFEFVWWTQCPNTLEKLDLYRDQPSVQARRNGIAEDKIAEGIVIRPLFERVLPNGKRVIFKHKRKEFIETRKPREVSLDRLEVLKEAQAIADEWVTEERLNHILDHIKAKRLVVERFQPSDTPEVIRAMLEDIKREGEGEIEWSKEAERAVCTATAKLFKRRVTEIAQPATT